MSKPGTPALKREEYLKMVPLLQHAVKGRKPGLHLQQSESVPTLHFPAFSKLLLHVHFQELYEHMDFKRA